MHILPKFQVKQTVKSKAAKKSIAGATKVRGRQAEAADVPDIVIGKKMTKTPAKLTKKGRKDLVS